MDVTELTNENFTNLQIRAYRSAFSLLSDDDKYELLETLLNDMDILSWRNVYISQPLLSSLVRMESAKYISKNVYDRMSQIIQVLVSQSLGSLFNDLGRTKLFIWSPSMPNGRRDVRMIVGSIQHHFNNCLSKYSPINIRILGYSKIEDKEMEINLSHLVHHYSDNIEKLTTFGYDLSGVLPGDD